MKCIVPETHLNALMSVRHFFEGQAAEAELRKP